MALTCRNTVPAVGNYLRYVNQWCIDSILEFRDSCRREGRVWAADGYGFSATKDKAYNIKQHKAVITHARYLHYFSGKKASLVRFCRTFYTNLHLIGASDTFCKSGDPEDLSRALLLGSGLASKAHACRHSTLSDVRLDVSG